MKRRFIVNPTARNGLVRKQLPRLAKFFSHDFDAVVTASWQEAAEQTRRALHDGVEQIIAIGGDGTLNAVVNGFFENGRVIRADAMLVASNCGTGSDYFRTVTAGAKRTCWTDLVANHEIRAVDVGCIESLNKKTTPNYFLNIASVGIPSAIVAKKLHWGLPIPIPSALSYLLPTLRAITSYHPKPVSIRGEDFHYEGDLLGCFIAKGTFCGGGMKFGGAVALDDGRFDVTVVGKLTLKEVFQRLPRIYGAGLQDEEKIRRRSSRWLEIHSASGLPVEFDGELRGQTDVRLSVEQQAVRLCFPRKAAYT